MNYDAHLFLVIIGHFYLSFSLFFWPVWPQCEPNFGHLRPLLASFGCFLFQLFQELLIFVFGHFCGDSLGVIFQHNVSFLG